MSTSFPTNETLLSQNTKSAKYNPYENQNQENPAFRFLPNFYFKWRWIAQSFLHKKVFRVFGLDFTLGGFLFFLLVIFTLPTVEYFILNDEINKFGYTGLLNFTILCLIFSFASRNSIWALLVGLSVERAIFWHKNFAFALVISAFIHGFINSWVSPTGLYLYFSFVGIFVCSLWFFRNRFFYYFYIIHLILICTIIYNAYHHARKYNLLACAFWFVDLTIRFLFYLFFMYKGSSFNLRLSSNKRFIEVSSKGQIISHRPGQFFFLTIPRISVIEPHPFSATSVSEDGKLVFCIRSLGDWTGKLAKIAETQSDITIFINGPYGIPTVDIENNSTEAFILVAGGIGINFIKPYAHYLIDQVKRGRGLKSITLLWSVRETELIEFVSFSDVFLEVINEKIDGGKSDKSQMRSDFEFDLQVFLKSDLEAFGNIRTSVKSCVKRKPLDLDGFFKTFKQKNLKRNPERVKVLCCGPDKMIKHCFKLSQEYGYDVHSEYFEF